MYLMKYSNLTLVFSFEHHLSSPEPVVARNHASTRRENLLSLPLWKHDHGLSASEKYVVDIYVDTLVPGDFVYLSC